jgi:anti-sigma B factor antagonist
MAFQLHTREVGRITVLEAVGRLTLTDGHTTLRDLLHVSISGGAKKFILNLARVDFIDSYGIGELARSYSIVRQAGGELKLAAVQQTVLPVLEVSHMHKLFEVYPAEDAALHSFAPRA